MAITVAREKWEMDNWEKQQAMLTPAERAAMEDPTPIRASNDLTPTSDFLTGVPYYYNSFEKISHIKFINARYSEARSLPGIEFTLEPAMKPFNFIWIACASRGTIVKIDTDSGKVLGEYRTAPKGRYQNPSRTTVDYMGGMFCDYLMVVLMTIAMLC